MSRYFMVDSTVVDTAAEADWWFAAIEDHREELRSQAEDARWGYAPEHYRVEPDPTYDPWEREVIDSTR